MPARSSQRWGRTAWTMLVYSGDEWSIAWYCIYLVLHGIS